MLPETALAREVSRPSAATVSSVATWSPVTPTPVTVTVLPVVLTGFVKLHVCCSGRTVPMAVSYGSDLGDAGTGVRVMRCSNCGAPIADNVRFCPSCGKQLGEPTQVMPVGLQPTAPLTPPPSQPHVQYIPPEQADSQPPGGPNRTLLWVGIAAGVVLLIVLAVLIPLALRGGGGEGGLTTSTTESTTSTSAPVTTSTVAPTSTTVPVAGPVGDSVGSWVEIGVPGGPWAVQEVAVSDEALLLVTPSAVGYKLSAVMLDSGDVVTISQSEALFGVDLDGLLAVWWEASGWNAGTETYAKQYIKTCLLPGTAKNTIATGGADRLGMPQVSSGVVTWVVSGPWAADPEYWTERIMATKVKESGAATGSPTTVVPAALAFALGDSGWQYSLSGSRVAWQHGTTAEGYDIGTHVIRTDKTGHQHIGADAWRPSLWGDLLVYQDGNLKVKNLATSETRVLDPSGDFAAAGPTFAAYYKPSSSGSFLVARGYTGAHEQTLDQIGQPPYFAPVISVSSRYIAYTFEEQLHLFEWQAQ